MKYLTTLLVSICCCLVATFAYPVFSSFSEFPREEEPLSEKAKIASPGSIMSIDLAAIAIRSPLGDQCFTEPQVISVEIKNVGTGTLDFAASPASIQVSITGAQTNTYAAILDTGTLVSGADTILTITRDGDFSVLGRYMLELSTNISGDSTTSNDTIRSSLLSLPLATAPVLETFDSFVDDGNFAGIGTGLKNGFVNDPLGPTQDFNWSVRTGPTGSGSTGPDADHSSGNGSYMYTESSAGAVGDTALLISPCIDLSSTSAPGLRLYYHMFGATTGTLEVDVLTPDSQTQIFSISGQQQSAGAAAWKAQTLNLTAFASDTIQVVFRAIRGASSTGDMALDDVEIIELPEIDMELTSLEGAGQSFCVGNRSVAVEITNKGLLPIDFANVSATISTEITGANPMSYLTNITTGTLAVGTSQSIVIDGSGDFSNPGENDFLIAMTVANDGNSSNDTLRASMSSLPIQLAPFQENFTAFVSDGNVSGDGTGLTAGWMNNPTGPTDNFNWSVRSGSTGSGNTGPSGDYPTGTGSYLYTEASFGAEGDTAYLISPCIDLGTLAFPAIRFAYHMFGADIGTLEVDVLSKGVQTNIFSKSGPQQQASSDPFLEFRSALSAFAGDTIQLIFKGVKGAGPVGDIAIDEVEIFELLAKNPGLSALHSPRETVCVDATSSIQVEIRNEGRLDLDFSTDSITIDVFLFGANIGIYSTTLNRGMLEVDSSLRVQITDSADFSQTGSTQLRAMLLLHGQGSQANDTLISTIVTVPIVSAPFEESFATFIDDGNFGGNATGLVNGWINDPMGPSSEFNWSVRTGPTGSGATGPDADHSLGTPDGTYLYTESSNPGAQTTLLSPCIDISTLNNPGLSYWYHMFGAEMGTLKVFVISGTDEILLSTLTGQQQSSGTSPWLRAYYLLPAGLRDTIQLKFVGIQQNGQGSFSSDMAIDDVQVLEIPPKDLSVLALSPEAMACSDAAVPLMITLESRGADTLQLAQDSIVLDIVISGALGQSFTTTIASGNLVFGEGRSLEIPVDFSAIGVYEVEVSIKKLDGDARQEDDTLRTVIHSLPSVDTFPYIESFESGDGDWIVHGNNSSWELGPPSGALINSAASGLNSWVTNLDGFYSSNEDSYVQSPCFDLTSVNGAWVSLDIWYESEFSWDGAVLQSSVDLGNSWQNVGAIGDSGNWYNDEAIASEPGAQLVGWTGRDDSGTGGWLHASHALDSSLNGQRGVIFRIAFASDGSEEDEGFAFDNFTLATPPKVDLGRDDTLCIGAILDAGPGASFLWSNGDTSRTISLQESGLEDSLISVVVKDSLGFTGTDTVRISIVEEMPIASFDFRVQGGEVVFTNTSTGDYLKTHWDFGDGSSSRSTSTNHFYNSNGEFTVNMIVSNACGADTVRDTVLMTTTGIEEDLLRGLSIYPNPSSGIFDLELHAGDLDEVVIRVLSINGTQVFDKELGTIRGGFKTQIRLPVNISSGLYLLQIQTRQARVHKRIEVK